MKGSNDMLDVVDAMEFAEVLYKCRLCTVVPCVVSSKYIFNLHVRSIHLTSSKSLQLAGCRRCSLKFATEEDLFDHKKLSHGIFEHQLNPETGKENHVAASGQRTDISHAVPHWSDGENNNEDSPMHAVQHTRYNADQEYDCVSEDERTGAEDASFKTHIHTGETHEPHKVNNTSDANYHTDITNDEKGQVQRTLFNILPKNRVLASSIKRCHTESSLHDDPQRFVFLTAPDTDVPDHAQNVAGSLTSSPKSKRKRTVPVACRSVPTQSPMSDTSMEDSDLDEYDIHKHTLKETPVDKDDGDHIEKPANDTNNESNTEDPVPFPAETTDTSLPVNGRLLDAQKCLKTEWSLGPFVSNSVARSDNASPHSDGLVAPSAGESEKQCLYCDYKYVDFEDYSQHYTERHVNSSTGMLDMKQDPANSSQLLGEPFVTKSNKIKEILPEFVCSNMNGCVSRSALMDRLAERLQQPDLTNWAPACNKAIRELFPHSQALRKGKYKKTYFFGIQFTGCVATSLSSAEKMDFVLDEDDPNFIPSPLRDMGKDTERLLKVLPCVIRFTGHMNNCVTRDMLLYILSEQLSESDVTNWGTQCNRAVRHLYPQTYLKRKGKFKTTCYFGIQLQDYIEARTLGKFGPPVVDVRDIISDDMIGKWVSQPPVGGASGWPADVGIAEGMNEEKPGERTEETKVTIKQEPMEDPSFSTLEDVSPTLAAPPADNNVLERIVLLHPGPFVTERILRHRCMSLKPSSERAQHAMSMLQTRGLGEIRTVKPSNLKVFYKAMPHDSLEEPLSAFSVRLVDYQLMFCERDPKLEDTVHDQVKLASPKLDTLPLFYKY